MQKFIDILKSLSSPNLAAIRHGLTVISTMLAVLGIASFKGVALTTIVDQIISVIQAGGVLITAIITFIGVVGPIIMGWYARWSAKDAQQIKRVEEIANDPTRPRSLEAKAAILDAAASLPEVTKPIPVTDPVLADITDNPLVVPVIKKQGAK